MKLLSCYITGFGKFENRSFEFTNGLNCIYSENGWGKTTLADFIASMLYGIDGGRSKSLLANDRIRYAPFSGARFGGALTFSYLGRIYRVERFFGKTPAMDSVKIYDESNMQSYIFGDKAERLGETLLGMDRDSFMRSVYLPQGLGQIDGLTGDIKEILTALLTVSENGNGAQTAMDRLDNAERALRAKRKPAKGKLDELDEKLSYLQAKQAECIRAKEQADTLIQQAKQSAKRVEELKAELKKITAQMEEATRRNERLATRVAQKEILTKKEEAELRLQGLKEFFGQANPKTVNVAGIKKAIDEYYAVKAEIEELKRYVEGFSALSAEREGLKTRIAVNEQTLENYKQMSAQEEKLKKEKRKSVKKSKNKKTHGNFWLIVSLIVAIIGATQLETRVGLGATLLLAGSLGILIVGAILLKNVGFASGRGKMDKALRENYDKLFAETSDLKAELEMLLEKGESERELRAKIEEKQARLIALDNAIKGFLAHFAFGEIYDYRSAYQTLLERIDEYTRQAQAVEACDEKLKDYAQIDREDNGEYTALDMDELRRRQANITAEAENATAQTARLYAEAEGYEKTALALPDFEAEETRLTVEKARLEKRLTAIRSAKELLTRARANMASRYLQPVEKKAREYAQILGFSLGDIKLSAEGKPLIEDRGATYQTDYYSAGLKDLLWLCVRLALAETLFTKELPPLILDDPLVNLDDNKTERAKALIKALSSKFQILYFTCKNERGL